MFKAIAFAALSLAGCGHAAAQPAPAAKPACQATVVVVRHNAPVRCDVTPPQRLDVIFNASTEGRGWGGDASLARADAECADMGGRAVWRNGNLRCQDVDY